MFSNVCHHWARKPAPCAVSTFSFSVLNVILGLARKCPRASQRGKGVLMASEISPEDTEKNLEGFGVRQKDIFLGGTNRTSF